MTGILMAFLGSYCPAILFNIERKKLIWAGLCGAISWTAFNSVLTLTGSNIFAAFVAALVISFMSEIMAKILKTPATVFYIPSLFSIVPGIPAYYTVLYIIENKITEAVYKGIETAASAGAIAFGILLVSTTFKYINSRGR